MQYYLNVFIIGCLFFFCQEAAAQKYKRLYFKGGLSARVLVKYVKPKDLNNKEKRFNSLKFYKKGSSLRVLALDLNKVKKLEGFGMHSTANDLIKYRNIFDGRLDSIYIFVDTLASGFIKKKYPYVDLYLVDSFDSSSNGCNNPATSYSILRERWMITEDYLYWLKVHRIDLCTAQLHPKTKRILFRDFRKFCRSVRLD